MMRQSRAILANTEAGKKLTALLTKELEDITAAGTFKNERVIISDQKSEINVETAKGPVLNFCANNYLGLGNNKDVIQAAKEAMDIRGYGMASVRFICGTTDMHKKLEHQISQFVGTEDAILYPSCFDANGGVFEVMASDQDILISDELNHASIIDGIRLCKAERARYNHLDMAMLEKLLKEASGKRMRWIVTDGVFSMDGDVAPLDKIVKLAEQYCANIFVDDSHATGFMGPRGRGTPELFGVQDKIDVLNTTFGKALGGASGGCSCGTKEIVALQRQRGRPYLFSNTIPPASVGGVIKVMDILAGKDNSFLKRLQDNTKLFRSEMKKAGFEISGHDTCPIAPVMLYDARVAAQFAEKMMAKSIYVIAFSYPVVPKDKARIRVQLSSAHSKADVERAIQAFIDIKKEMKI